MTPATLEKGSRSNRYPAKCRAFAERAHKRGHSIKEIKAALALKGYHPAWKTVAYWADPEHAEAHRIKERKRGRPERYRTRRWNLALERLWELREMNASFPLIAAILNKDFGLSLTENQVRGIVNGETTYARVRKIMGAES